MYFSALLHLFPLPRAQLKPTKLPCVLLVSPRKRQVFVVKSKEIPHYEARRAIPNNVSAPQRRRLPAGLCWEVHTVIAAFCGHSSTT